MLDHYIQEYGRRLYGLCMALCRNPADADDLYQDTWMKVLLNLDRYNPSLPFEPWLTRICVNTWRNALRRIGRSPIFNEFTTSEEKDRMLEAVHTEPPQDHSDLHTAIRLLPEKLRLVIVLFYFQGMDIRSTARILRIPEGTVKSRLNKAKKRLKEVLPDEADL